MNEKTDPNAARKAWLGLLARCRAADLNALWTGAALNPDHTVLRSPVRGRAGAVGSAFNLGEVTVTRASVRLASGQDGHGYVQGRDKVKATQAALIDALMQTAQADAIRAAVLTPLQEQMAQTRATRSAKAAATKVDFFTMVRGED